MPPLPQLIRRLRYRIFYGLVLSRRFELVTLCAPGSICPWTICPTGLGPRSVVYSAGVGSDISFEHELVKRFGCNVVLCDPSPTGVKTMSQPENQIPQFRFFPAALAGEPGKLTMSPPLDPQGDAWFAGNTGRLKVEVEALDVASLMKRNGHDYIDLLKLDIEGCEYQVIDDILSRRLPIRQICVEYHHGILPGFRRKDTLRSMFRLMARGYKMLNQEGSNHTFLRPSLP